MPSFVVFNGVTRYAPGGITRVNAEALNQVLLSDNSTIGIIGESDGGIPGSLGLVSLDDPTRVTSLFRSGPIVDAGLNVFQPSGDPRVPGGASSVVFFKTNNSTQSSVILPGAPADEFLTSAATGGSTTTLIDTALSGLYADDAFNGKKVVLRPQTATAEVTTVTDYVASTQTMTIDTVLSAPVALDEYIVVEDTSEVLDIIDDGASTTTIITLNTITSLVGNAHAGSWVTVTTASYVETRKVVSNTTSTITITPALPSAPSVGSYVEVLPNSIELTSLDYGAHTNGLSVDVAAGTSAGSKVITVSFEGVDETSGDVGGFSFMKLLYKGGSIASTDTVDAGATTTVIPLVTGGLTPSGNIGDGVLIDGEYTVITANTASQITVSPALSEAPATTTVVSFRAAGETATATINGASGVATSLTTDCSEVPGDNLSISFPAGMSIRELVATINLNTNYEAVVPDGINPDVNVAEGFDFGPLTTQSIMATPALTDSTVGFTQDTQQMVNYINTVSAYVGATRSTDFAKSGALPPGETLDVVILSGGSRGTSANSDFQAGFDAMLTVRVNSVVPLIDQDLVNEGYGSTATVKAVHAQAKGHVIAARGASASERGAFVGFRGTKAAVIAQANSLNDADVALCCQNPTLLNALGNLQEYGPRMMAVVAAGMRAGVSEIGEPLTHKLLRTSGVTQDSGWSPGDTTDSNDLIKAGVLFTESVAGQGTRWVRDLTTWVVDNNLAYSEGSVRDVIRYVAYGLRNTLTNRYVGRKASPARISSIKDTAASYLEVLRSNEIIVDSTDLATGTVVRAYHNLAVTSTGDSVLVKVGVYPVPGINFILNDIYVQIPTQSA